MKTVLILAPADNPHTIKWVNSLQKVGHKIILFSLGTYNKKEYLDGTIVHSLNQAIGKEDIFLSKFKYLKAFSLLKTLLKDHKPDIVHAHYATSYGVLGALLNFRPFVLSVWGSDIYLFPKKSFIHKSILQYSLRSADMILSTSFAMKKETQIYTDKNITVLPFGIDVDKFRPLKKNITLFDVDDLVVGTVKNLEKVYGIEYLLRAFKIVSDAVDLPLKLLIVGEGREEKYLKELSKELKISHNVLFTGYILPSEIVDYHNMMNIEVFMSERESFGVSVLEASACEHPVVVSDVGGLPEVVDSGITGYIVENKNYRQAAEVLRTLVHDPVLCKKLGISGRKMVQDKYNWKNSVLEMSNIYESCFD